jgi:hypothetical protein|tara:strand:- start:1289 stop:1615 length:327 start_codon:yes stop_codon:yes gene_type:complete
MVEIKEFTTSKGEIYQQYRIGGGYMSFDKKRQGNQPHFKGAIKINELPIEIVAWWRTFPNSTDKYLSLSLNFKKQKDKAVDIDVLPSDVLQALGLPEDFNNIFIKEAT